ncbi:MAG TPA: ATP-binding cassette domain-containing protein [Vicinamibacterales bacterium]|nr:ATP-binding cassette domain-containing protein [Vicinamibacterales bacterium]
MNDSSRASAIAFRDVHFSRGAQPVLRGFSLEIAAGDTLALVGRSGAGKSTILKLINRLLVPDSGEVIVESRPTQAWDPFELRRRAGYVMQEVGLFPHLTVEQNIATVPRLLGWESARVERRVTELLELVGLDAKDHANRRPDQLSGGQRQRVGVARALAADPPILLMDEPFGALDPVTRAEMHREFRRIQDRVRKTVVLVTHDMAEAFALATHVGVLSDGVLAVVGEPATVARSTDSRVRPLLDPLIEATAVLGTQR